MEFKEIIYSCQDGVATITLNRPDTLNSFSANLTREWWLAQEEAQRDEKVRVIVVTGAGRAFCAGGNPREMAKTGRRGMASHFPQLVRSLLQLAKPYIGAINGPCVGGGWEVASLFDLRIASEKARFGTGFIRMGGLSPYLGCYILPRLVGLPRALELLWTGRFFDAQEALAAGFVIKVVPHEELMPATMALAQSLARGPAVAIREIKRLTYDCLHLTPAEAMLRHRRASQLVSVTEDALEGPRAWAEKREPVFKGR